MEALIKQARLRFSGTEEVNSTRGRTPSFRRENGPQKWIRRQLSRQMSSQQSGEEADNSAAAVAAVAVAITSLENSISVDQTQIRDGQWASLPGTRSKIADAEPGQAPISYAAKDSHKNGNFEALDAGTDDRIPEKTVHPVPSFRKTRSQPKKRLTFADDQFPQDSTVSKDEETNTGRIKPTSFRKTSTSRKEEALKDTKIVKPEASVPILPSPVPPPAIPPLNIRTAVPPKLETQVDAWEREEMAKIKERYEEVNATILDWEDNKKKKARHKLEMTENEQPARRTKAIHKYQIEMEEIKDIADGARAQAKDKKRNEEMKVKEKANRYRATGQLPQPPACRCW